MAEQGDTAQEEPQQDPQEPQDEPQSPEGPQSPQEAPETHEPPYEPILAEEEDSEATSDSSGASEGVVEVLDGAEGPKTRNRPRGLGPRGSRGLT